MRERERGGGPRGGRGEEGPGEGEGMKTPGGEGEVGERRDAEQE